MNKNNIILPISILIASIVLGGFFYASQTNKQKSIERQQIMKQMEDRRIEEAKTEQVQKEKDAEIAKENFNNNLKCQTLLKDLKQRWNNVVGIYYNEIRNTCIVKYTEKGEVIEAPLESMQDN